MVPHTLTNSDLTRSPNNRGNSLLGQEGVISRRFFCLRIEGAPSALLLTVKRWNKLRRAIQSKPVGVLTRGECLLHDDAPPSTPPAGTAAVLQVRSIGRPSHSPDLSPCHYLTLVIFFLNWRRVWFGRLDFRMMNAFKTRWWSGCCQRRQPPELLLLVRTNPTLPLFPCK